MKKMKRLVALALSVVMVLAMSVFAFADETYTITIKNASEGHTYEAYQIFAGDLSDGVLSNIKWGTGVSEAGQTALGDAAEKAATLTDEASAAAFAKEVAQYLQDPKESTAASGEYTISGLAAGYYLVKDKNNSLQDSSDFYTAYIMEVVGNVEATPKGDKPTLDKEIKHNESGEWGVVGDNQVGDTVEFRTITTVPDTSGYTSYDYVINDTMSDGLTSNVKGDADVTIKVNDKTTLDSSYYTVTANGNTFSITVDILKAVEDGVLKKGDKLYSYYTATLNKDALVYDQGKQSNTANLEYSNNPNDTTNKGKTPDKTVYDWTFKMGVNKVNKDGESLNGAEFVLSKNGKLTEEQIENNTELIKLIKNDDGTYTVAPEDYDGDTTYTITAGNVTIKGLDDATDYYLYETKAPEKYNKLTDPVHFKISATYNEAGDKTTSVTVKVGDNDESTTLQTDVVNESGSTLPSTGGIGTTIFYVIGGILMVGAAVLLITKRRAEN